MRVFIKTFGCRSNIFDSQIIKSQFNNIANNEDSADLVIINSCTVTNFADRDIKRYIKKLKNKKVIFTGCGAYTIGKELFEKKLVDAVLGHKFKKNIKEFVDFKGIKLGDFDYLNFKIVDNISTTKAFIKIQEGCNFKCSYCIIPFVRGPSRSVKKEEILKQVKVLVENGIKEIVLTGINLGSYNDNGYKLSDLIEDIIKIKGVKRVRVGSIEPSQVDEKLIDLLNSNILEKHLHIALQTTSDKLLRIMNRRNRVKETLELFEFLASKNIALGSDIIVGHPGEDDEVWQEVLENFKKYPLTHIHIFRYSKKDGTKSAKMQQIRGDIAKERAKILQDIVDKNAKEFRKKLKEVLVHVEKVDDFAYGYDEYYFKHSLKGDFAKGEWVKINLKDRDV